MFIKFSHQTKIMILPLAIRISLWHLMPCHTQLGVIGMADTKWGCLLGSFSLVSSLRKRCEFLWLVLMPLVKPQYCINSNWGRLSPLFLLLVCFLPFNHMWYICEMMNRAHTISNLDLSLRMFISPIKSFDVLTRLLCFESVFVYYFYFEYKTVTLLNSHFCN